MAMQSLSSSLIMLSDHLKVYDVVDGRTAVRHPVEPGRLSMAHLAVSSPARVFAVVLSTTRTKPHQGDARTSCGAGHLLARKEASHSSSRSCRAPSYHCYRPWTSPGFIVVDAAAQVRSLVDTTDTTALLARPLASLSLDINAEPEQADDASPVVHEVADEEDSDGEEGDDDEAEGTWVDDDRVHEAVIAPQLLADIFDAAPAFAMPPIEELFYQVTGLISAKPIAASSGA